MLALSPQRSSEARGVLRSLSRNSLKLPKSGTSEDVPLTLGILGILRAMEEAHFAYAGRATKSQKLHPLFSLLREATPVILFYGLF